MRAAAADILKVMSTQAGYAEMPEEELLEGLRCSGRDSDGIARAPELLGTFPEWTEKDAEELGAMEDPAAEAAFESLVRGRAGKTSACPATTILAAALPRKGCYRAGVVCLTICVTQGDTMLSVRTQRGRSYLLAGARTATPSGDRFRQAPGTQAVTFL